MLNGCLSVVGAIVFVVIAFQQPWLWLMPPLAVAGVAAYRLYTRRQNKIASVTAFRRQAQALEILAAGLGTAGDVDKANPITFTLQPDETLIETRDGVRLLEWQSSGSRYRGGNMGLSFRVMNGVYYNAGTSGGQITKNEANLALLDEGTVHFSTKRIIFIGPRETRSWDVSKVLNLEIDHNGQTVMISVSNRQAPSALQGSTFAEVAPGFLVQASVTMANYGTAAAAQELREYASQFIEVAENTSRQLKLT
ncbi:MAG: hypothetical protein RL196_792 [Actinomycetota bacterium]|jgi:hypothetical protein